MIAQNPKGIPAKSTKLSQVRNDSGASIAHAPVMIAYKATGNHQKRSNRFMPTSIAVLITTLVYHSACYRFARFQWFS